MENAVDALKMAGSVLLFVIGLTVAILAFTQARVTIDAVLKLSDREYLTIEGDERFYYLADGNSTNRIVGLDTVIPTIYRTYKESYKIAFVFPGDYYLYLDNKGNKVMSLEYISGFEEEFLNGILYGVPAGPDTNRFNMTFQIGGLNSTPLFDYLKGKTIVEELGIYNFQDVAENTTDSTRPEAAEIDPANQKTRRVITYTIKDN